MSSLAAPRLEPAFAGQVRSSDVILSPPSASVTRCVASAARVSRDGSSRPPTSSRCKPPVQGAHPFAMALRQGIRPDRRRDRSGWLARVRASGAGRVRRARARRGRSRARRRREHRLLRARRGVRRSERRGARVRAVSAGARGAPRQRRHEHVRISSASLRGSRRCAEGDALLHIPNPSHGLVETSASLNPAFRVEDDRTSVAVAVTTLDDHVASLGPQRTSA